MVLATNLTNFRGYISENFVPEDGMAMDMRGTLQAVGGDDFYDRVNP